MSLRLRSNLLYQKFVMNESPATASLRSATPKKNVPCKPEMRWDNCILFIIYNMPRYPVLQTTDKHHHSRH